jgi:hypothetical protein
MEPAHVVLKSTQHHHSACKSTGKGYQAIGSRGKAYAIGPFFAVGEPVVRVRALTVTVGSVVLGRVM